MSQETVVDETSQECDHSSHLHLHHCPLKGKDIVRWIEVGIGPETKKVPFVYNHQIGLLWCCHNEMKGQVCVKCLKGCYYNDRQCEEDCTCFCHALSIDGTGLVLERKAQCEKSWLFTALRPARSVHVCLGVCASVWECVRLFVSVCLPVLFGQDTRKNTRTMSIVCLGRCGCLSVCLPAGWLVCLSVSVGLSVSVCLSVWVCLGVDLSGSVWVWSVSVSVSKATCDCPQKTSKTTCSIPFTSSSRTGHTTEHIHDINRTVSHGLPRRLRFLRCP